MPDKDKIDAEVTVERRRLRNTRWTKVVSTKKSEDEKDRITAERCGLSGNLYSQLKGGKPIGEELARKIEKWLDKPRYWLDGIEDPMSLTEREQTLLNRYRKLDTDGERFLLGVAAYQRSITPTTTPEYVRTFEKRTLREDIEEYFSFRNLDKES